MSNLKISVSNPSTAEQVLSFYRGDTVKHPFIPSIPVDDIEKLSIIYTQQNREIITKTYSDCAVDKENNTLLVTLTPDESFSFVEGAFEVQLCAVIKSESETQSSPIYKATAKRVLRKEVL